MVVLFQKTTEEDLKDHNPVEEKQGSSTDMWTNLAMNAIRS